METEILRAERLTKIYGTGENQVKALDDVSFSVQKGEFLAIIGPSGSGKSTLLHVLGGVDVPTSGKVFMEGTEHGVGMVTNTSGNLESWVERLWSSMPEFPPDKNRSAITHQCMAG